MSGNSSFQNGELGIDEISSVVNQFLEIVGNTITRGEAAEILKSCGWSLENALAVHFAQYDEENCLIRGSSTGFAASPHRARQHYEFLSSSASSSSSSSSTSSPFIADSRINGASSFVHSPPSAATPPSAAAATSVASSSLSSLSSSPSRSVMSGLSFATVSVGRRIGKFLNSFADAFCSVLRLLYSAFLCPVFNLSVGEHLNFNAFYESRFGTPKPEFFSGDFLQACDFAKRHRKVLLVYLHVSSSSNSTGCICEKLFKNQGFRELVSQSAVIWATFTSRLESHLLRRRALQCRQLPHLSFFAPTQSRSLDLDYEAAFSGSSSSSSRSTLLPDMRSRVLNGFHLVGILEGATIDDVENQGVNLLSSAVEFIESDFINSSREQSKLEETRRLRLEQDKAYAATVQKDKELLAKAEAERDKRQKELQEREARLKSEEAKKRKKEQLQMQWRQQQLLRGRRFFIREYIKYEAATAAGAAGGVTGQQQAQPEIRIRIRLPEGVRVERRFKVDSFLIDLFDWVDGVADILATIEENKTEFFHEPLIKYINLIVRNSSSRQINSAGGRHGNAVGQSLTEATQLGIQSFSSSDDDDDDAASSGSATSTARAVSDSVVNRIIGQLVLNLSSPLQPQQLPIIPTRFYLSSSFTTSTALRLNRPSEEEADSGGPDSSSVPARPMRSTTLKEIGLESDAALFLHPIDMESDEEEPKSNKL